MIQAVASQQSPLSRKAQGQRPGAKERPQARPMQAAHDGTGSPRNDPLIELSKPSVRRVRLVGEGGDPAQKVWRLQMLTSESAIKLPGLAGARRVFSAARALLALLGLTVVLGAALPLPREAALRQIAAWAEAWEDSNSNVIAGTIQAGTGDAAPREQRAVTEFIARRYRVAQDATAGFVATAYRAGSEWQVDPLLILAVMAIESRYNPVAESTMGAKGLMQVIPKYHPEKIAPLGGESALLDPHLNIQVGAQILREYLRRFGETETALQMYAGAFDEPGSSYALKVLAERARLVQLLKQVRQTAV